MAMKKLTKEKDNENYKPFIAWKFSTSISQPHELNKCKNTHLFIILGAAKFKEVPVL